MKDDDVPPPRMTFDTYQVLPRRTPTVTTPSRFQSPTTGTSPALPYVNLVPSSGSTSAQNVSTSCQPPSRKMPGWSYPSPFQSPTTGFDPASPKRSGWSAGPVLSE